MFKKIIPKDKLFWKYFLSYILIFIIPYLIFFNLGYIRLKHLTNINNAKYYNIKLSEFQTFFDNISKDIYNIKDMIDRSKLFREMVFTKNVYEKEIEGFFLRELRNELKTLRDSSPHIMDILINLDGDDTIYSIYGLFEKPTLYSTNLDIHTNVFGLEQTIPINSFLIQKQLYINSTPQEFIIYGDRLSTYSTKNTKGSLRIIINMNSIKESFSNMFNDNSLLFFATTNNNTDNTPIFCNNTDIVIENNLLTMLDHNKIIGLNNENYVKFYVPANYLDLKYLLLIPDDIYSRELKTLNIYVIFLNFIVFVICILISFMFSKKYFTPIDNIIRKLDTKGSIHQDGMLFINENIDTILNEKNVLNYELKTYRSNIRQLLLHKLFIPEEINDDFIEKLKQYDIEFEDNYFCAVKVSLPKAVLKTNQSNKYLKLTLILKKIVVQTLKQFLVTGYIIEQESFKDFIILFNIDNYVTILKMLSEISSKYNVLDSDISPSFGIGSIYQGIENINNSYKEAVKALKYRIIEGEGAVIQYNTINNIITDSYYYPIATELSLINYVKEGDFNKASELLEKIIQENIYSRNLDSDTAKYVSNEIISTAIKVIDQLNLNDVELIEYEYLDSLETIFETYEYIREIYKNICIIIKQKYVTNKKELDAAIIDFVDNNCFERHLSLDLISNKYKVSYSHISSLFREKLGVTYLEYVNKRRVQKAITYLKTPNTCLTDICLKVGYDNARTFRRNFKKYTGYNPSEYIIVE